MKVFPLVKVKKLTKTYQMEHGKIFAVQDVNLEIYRGESLAIMGPSGSGKSTLLHLLGCLERVTQGLYFLDNRSIFHMNDLELSLIRASYIGFVFQNFNLIPQLTVFENIEIPFLYQKTLLSSQERRNKILASLEKVGLTHRLYHRPLQLSGGEMQRAAIARALAIDPLLILADEPTGNLDTETGHVILTCFQELHRQGVTLVIVTHDEHVGNRCQRLIHMRDGTIISDQHNPMFCS